MTFRLLAAIVVLAVACAPQPAADAPARAPDIKRAKIDIAYSAIVSASYAKPTSRELLAAALDAIRAEVRRSGGRDVEETPS